MTVESTLHARPKYDRTYTDWERLIEGVVKYYDFPMEDTALIPSLGTLLSGIDKLGYSLVKTDSEADPDSTDGRRKLLALYYERSIYES
jgi:hypothetical protein